jgi:sentrin-specific protease 7
MICDETLYLEPHLTFSLDGIKIEYLDLDSFEDEKLVALQWEISNIISISCKWTQSVSNSLYFTVSIPLILCFFIVAIRFIILTRLDLP